MYFAYAAALLTSSPPVKIETEIEEYCCAAEEEDVFEEDASEENWKFIIFENRGIEVQAF